LDEEAFPAFATFLAASQDYAKLTGCRFSLASFEGIEFPETAALPVVSEARARDTGALLGAKLRALPVVNSTREKLQMESPELEKELAQAFEVVMQESTRNAMIARCKELELFPPSPAPSDVEDTDCSWDDVCAPLASIAQRLYNDEVRRLRESVGGVNPLQRRAKTASYIVEFADEVGIKLPEKMPEDYLEMLRKFEDTIATLRKSQAPSPEAPREELVGSFFQDAGDLASGIHSFIDSWTLSGAASDAQATAQYQFSDTDGDVIELTRASGKVIVSSCGKDFGSWQDFDEESGIYKTSSRAHGKVPAESIPSLVAFLDTQVERRRAKARIGTKTLRVGAASVALAGATGMAGIRLVRRSTIG
jgi:hypothetical protein